MDQNAVYFFGTGCLEKKRRVSAKEMFVVPGAADNAALLKRPQLLISSLPASDAVWERHGFLGLLSVRSRF